MLRRFLSGWSLVAVLLFAVTLPAVADEEADKIKGGFEWYFQSVMAGYPGVELRHDIEVAPVEGEYEVTVGNLTIADKASGDTYPLGDFLARVVPLENGDYRFHSVRVPEEIRVVDPQNTSNSAVVRLGLEKFEGIMSPRAGYASAHELIAKNISVTLNFTPPEQDVPGVQTVDLQIAELTSEATFQETRENAVDQEIAFSMRGLLADFGDGATFRIGESSGEAAVSLDDVAGAKRAQERAQTIVQNLGESPELDEKAELAVMRSAIEIYSAFSKVVQRGTVENLTFDSPALKVGVQESNFDLVAANLDEDLSSQEMLISSRGFFVSIPTNPGLDVALQMVPRRWTLPVKFQRVPVKGIFEDAQVLFGEISSMAEFEQESARVDAFNAKLEQRIREAGTTILLDGQSIESDAVTATMDGLLKVRPDSPIGVEGSISAQAVGLMQLFEQAQTIPDPQAAQHVMQGAMVLLSTGETEPGEQVPSVTNYRFEFTPDGAVLLNGNQMHPPPAAAQ